MRLDVTAITADEMQDGRECLIGPFVLRAVGNSRCYFTVLAADGATWYAEPNDPISALPYPLIVDVSEEETP